MANWQQDLTPVHRDSSSSHLYVPGSPEVVNRSSLNKFYFMEELNDCKKKYASDSALMSNLHPEGFCKVSFDSIMCWPPTPFNGIAKVECFSEFNNIKYDVTKNITRECNENGTWLQANYLNCDIVSNEDYATSNSQIYYFVGYTISLVALTIAIFVFTYFKELKCLRNTIHLNLMWSHLFTHFMWILTLLLLKYNENVSIVCLFDITLLYYFYVTTFFWMFVEGLYLYILVVKTLYRESFKLRVYVCIGWGIPFLIIVTWAVAKSFISITNRPFYISCQWVEHHKVDWIFLTPTLIVLLLNLIFLFSIMCVLIMKLRSAPTQETKQYHKATRALLVLIPLLGITYVITIYAPTPDTSSTFIFECARAVLLSTQGFVVSLFYCFFNSEVQNTLKHHFQIWKDNRTVGSSKLRFRNRTNSTRHTEWTLVQADDIELQEKSMTQKNGYIHSSVKNGEQELLQT